MMKSNHFCDICILTNSLLGEACPCVPVVQVCRVRMEATALCGACLPFLRVMENNFCKEK